MFNHAMDLAFQVVSEHEDWGDCLERDKELVKKALLERVESLFQGDEYLEAISGFDSYEVE
tara:strand:+ start:552 stop:734 length:183 start_codon:yes stop_codon:yes gene_type:complete